MEDIEGRGGVKEDEMGRTMERKDDGEKGRVEERERVSKKDEMQGREEEDSSR